MIRTMGSGRISGIGRSPMGAKLTVYGFDRYFDSLVELDRKTVGICKQAVYEGANIVANSVRNEIYSIPATKVGYVPGTVQIEGVTRAQRSGLLSGLGIAKMRVDNGFVHTKTGFNGYNDRHTIKYPNGQPNNMIAWSLERGSGKHKRYAFISTGAKKAWAAATKAMAEKVNEEINKITEG